MPSEHARLSPSSAGRWLACPASVRMDAEVLGYSDSSYAREGTIAHTRAELEARFALGQLSEPQMEAEVAHWHSHDAAELTDEQIEEMIPHCEAYGQLIAERRAEVPHTVVFLEQRVHPGVPQCFGTGDAVLVSPTHVEIIDFKYGAGVPVDAYENPQLKLYALGALEDFGDVVGEVEWVRATIYQPRVRSEPSSAEYTPAELRDWRAERVLPMAELALGDDAPFHPGESQCRWCPAAGICKPRAEAAIAEDFSSDPDVLTDEELGEIMDRLPEFKEWAAAVEAVVFRKLYELEQDVPGWKVVKTEGKRSIVDPQQVISLLMDAGYTSEQVSRRQTKTLGDLEKLVGKAKLPELLGDLLKKGEGGKALVRSTDSRPPINATASARADFQEEPE